MKLMQLVFILINWSLPTT